MLILIKFSADSGAVCLASFISPLREHRKNARDIHEKDNLPFFEVFVDTPLEVCKTRDTKGLYKKCTEDKEFGKTFTGIGQNYEAPEHADLVLKAGENTVAECIQQILVLLIQKVVLVRIESSSQFILVTGNRPGKY